MNKINILKNKLTCQSGHTLVEAMIVVLIMLWICLVIFSLSDVISRIRAKSTLSYKLREDCRSGMHMLVRELRETSMDTIYTATDSDGHFSIGFAKPKKIDITLTDSTKITTIELDAGDIEWGKAVIYHTYNDAGNIILYRRELDGSSVSQTEVEYWVNKYVDDDKDQKVFDELRTDASGKIIENSITKKTTYIDIKLTVESEMKYHPLGGKTKTILLEAEVTPMNTGGD